MQKDHTAENIADELKNVTDECFAHTLNLIVQDSLKDDPVTNDVSKKCRDIVSWSGHPV